MIERTRITIRFNLLLLIYVSVCVLISELFEPQTQERLPWDAIFDSAPAISIILAISFVLFALLLGAKLTQEFWNRLISDVFNLRDINYQDALAAFVFFGAWTFKLIP